MADVFVNYKREERAIAERVNAQLRAVYCEAEHGMRIDALFPMLLETCVVPPRMQRYQWVDLTGAMRAPASKPPPIMSQSASWDADPIPQPR